MGTPVSIDIKMTPLEYLRRGFPDPDLYRVRPSDITPSEWKELLDHEIFWASKILRDMKGFLPAQDLIEELKLSPPFRQVKGRSGSAARNSLLRVMVYLARLPSTRRVLILLDRNGHWVTCEVAGGMDHLHFDLETDESLLKLLELGGWQLGLKMLQSVVEMVETGVEEKRKRLEEITRISDAYIGASLGRINAWRR